MNRADLADLTAFVAVADHLSFRAAASQLGVTPSALSHSMRQLEERLGVRLTESHDAQRIGDRRRLAPARAAAAGNRSDRRRARRLEPRAPAPLGTAADLRDPSGGGGGHRADLGTLLVDVPGSPPRARGGRGADRHRGEGIRRRDRTARPGAGRHDCRSGDGADEDRRGWCADLFCAAAPAAHAR